MPTPISVHTIEGGGEGPKHFDYTLSLNFPVTQFREAVDPDLAVAMNRILRDWRDGRYQFFVEMIYRGLEDVIQNALYQVCQKRAQERYGNEMVRMSPTSQQSRWSIEADKEFKRLKTAGLYPSWHNSPEVKIERTEHK